MRLFSIEEMFLKLNEQLEGRKNKNRGSNWSGSNSSSLFLQFIQN